MREAGTMYPRSDTRKAARTYRKDMSTALHTTAFEVEDRAVRLRWARCEDGAGWVLLNCLLYTSPSPRDTERS
eukprot:4368245-Karenia_brevis.AAC.1